MRLFLLPISTRRTLLYCQRLNVANTEPQGWIDKSTTKAASLWASWEKKESGWQRKVVDYGNKALKRIPYEEWGLKSVPPLSTRREKEELSSKEKIEVVFPSSLIRAESVLDILKTLGTERQSLHQKRMIWSFVGMPIVAPFALVPVYATNTIVYWITLIGKIRIPNLPFFYLVFRAWSHWRALSGSKHIEFLVDKNLVNIRPSQVLDELYSTGKRPFETQSVPPEMKSHETMVLHESHGRRIAEALKVPELYIELDRAVWQVENALQAEKEQSQKAK
jgi:hypothetical protein